jgi:hypothetical protein
MTRLHIHLVAAMIASICAVGWAEPSEFDEIDGIDGIELEARDEPVIAKGVYVCSQPNWTGCESTFRKGPIECSSC